MTKTLFSPYSYTWSLNNSTDYKIPDLKAGVQKVGLKAATMAFLISDGTPTGVWSGFTQVIPDIIEFIKGGGILTISVGGANGPFIQQIMTQEAIVNSLASILKQTGCNRLDFDIEGGAITDTTNIDKLNKSIVQLQNKFSNLIISYTLPVGQPLWGGSLDQNGMNVINNAVKNGVKSFIVNGMCMDIGISSMNWSTMTIGIIESMKTQLKTIFPQKNDSELYAMIGSTPMTGIQDDSSKFTIEDAKNIAKYAVQKGLGFIGFWALQRDQKGSSNLALYNGTNTFDFEYYDAFATILGYPTSTNKNINVQLPTVPVTKPLNPIVPITKPVVPVISSNWSPNSNYNINSKVICNGKEYICMMNHTSSVLCAPGFSVWNLVSQEPVKNIYWENGINYIIGQQVIYNGIKYKCISSHKSIETWMPGQFTTSLWQQI